MTDTIRTMPVEPGWQRSLATGRPVGVDRKGNILRGYVLAQEGPFKTPGRGEFDLAGLREIVRLGNARPSGLKARFTHPDMSNDGLGTFLGRAKRLSLGEARDDRTGKAVAAVRGDLHFDQTALDTPPKGGKPLGQYVLDLAESDPDALSSSLVLQANEEFRRQKDGTLATDDDGNELPPLWRPTALHASDIVDTGDAVDGLLSASLSVEGFPLEQLWQGARLLDGVFEGQSRAAVEARCLAFLHRYLDRKFQLSGSGPGGEYGGGGFADPAPVPTPRLDKYAVRLGRRKV